MTVAGIRRYRETVINSVACPDCGANKGKRCCKIAPRYQRGDEMDYVHDGRSFLHYQAEISRLSGTENPFT